MQTGSSNEQKKCLAIETQFDGDTVACILQANFTLSAVSTAVNERPILLQHFHLYKRVEQVGQIVCCPDPHDGRKTLFVEIWTQRQIATRFQQTHEDKAARKAANRWIARELHRLCDWQLYNSLSLQQKNAIGVRIQRIITVSLIAA